MNDTPAFAHARFALLVKDAFSKIEELISTKGGEYSGDTDRLANFRRNGQTLGLPMEAVWSIYYNKHHDALMQYVKDLVSGKDRQRAEPLDGRIDDCITYLLLFKAMLLERQGEAKVQYRVDTKTGPMPHFSARGFLGEARKPMTPELQDLLQKAKAQVECMSEEEIKKMLTEQAKSWARGEAAMGNDRQEAEDRAARRGNKA